MPSVKLFIFLLSGKTNNKKERKGEEENGGRRKVGEGEEENWMQGKEVERKCSVIPSLPTPTELLLWQLMETEAEREAAVLL
jgi:hypothetical protein